MPNVSHFGEAKVAFSKKEKSATSCVEIADAERLTSVRSECEGSVTHARGSSEGSQGCREDADDDLNDGLPSFLFHSVFHLRVIHSRS